MELREYWRRHGKDHVLAAVLLMAFAFWINRGIEIKGLYMDDLYMWSCYGEQTFQEFVFPIGGTRCRPVFYLASYLEMMLMGTHIEWMVPINIILNGLVAWTIYGMAVKMSRSRVIGFFAGVLYLLSRFSYYQISQGWGLMETMALWMAISILYCLYQYLNEDHFYHYVTANILYFLVCFVHERYMVLIPLIFLVLVLKRQTPKREFRLWAIPALVFAGVQLIRLIAIGGLSPAGTGGTQVADTFSVGQVMKYALSQVAYLFGINAGPEHLNGISWSQTPGWFHGLVYASILVLALMILLFVAAVISRKEERRSAIGNSLLFICFIGGCIAASSVTIRVEMRWIYVSYTAAVLFLAYLYGTLTRMYHDDWKLRIGYGAMFGGYLLIMLPIDIFYRGYYPNLYYWPNQLRYNSLAEETYEIYGDTLFDKTVYIIGNTYEMSEFTADTFFKVYDKSREFKGPQVEFIDGIEDLGLITDDMIVLREAPERNGYQDITRFVRDYKCERVYGYYEDGWMDEQAQVKVMAGSKGQIELEFYYPGELTGDEIVRIYENGTKLLLEVPLTGETTRAVLETGPYERTDLTFKQNFYLEDAKEQRGETRFAMMVNMKAE